MQVHPQGQVHPRARIPTDCAQFVDSTSFYYTCFIFASKCIRICRFRTKELEDFPETGLTTLPRFHPCNKPNLRTAPCLVKRRAWGARPPNDEVCTAWTKSVFKTDSSNCSSRSLKPTPKMQRLHRLITNSRHRVREQKKIIFGCINSTAMLYYHICY